MPKIDTLVQDIYHVLDSTKDHEPDATASTEAAGRIGEQLLKATEKRDEPRSMGKLWASDLGKRCDRQHWYNFNEPEYAEKLSGHTKFKFLYGNLLEESVLWLAAEAGHKVELTQSTVSMDVNDKWTVRGRIDAVIDGVLVDVKSTSPYGFKEYQGGLNDTNDKFGYRMQLGFYHGFNDFTVPLEDMAGFVWIDKQNGHIAYTPCDVPSPEAIQQRAKDIVSSIEGTEDLATRYYTPKPYGKSGNMSLATECSYCPYKQRCWRDSNGGAGLRGYLYSNGPVWFTDIARPISDKVQEITNG